MQLLRGIDILLYDGGTPETVGNVLVGEPSADGRLFMIAIPKEDAHIWTDRKVGFFGRAFRTVGLPEEGIPENLPLCWNKKLRVEQITANGSCTVYEHHSFARHLFREVSFSDTRGERAGKAGAQIADGITVQICSYSHDHSYCPRAGDILVPGECAFEFDTASEQTVSESMAVLRKAHPDYAEIRSVSCSLCGLLPDYTITAG